jgi:hypothetical protein
MYRYLRMSVRAEELRAFHADGPITKGCAFGGTGNNTDVLGHDLDFKKRFAFYDHGIARESPQSRLTAVRDFRRSNSTQVHARWGAQP